MVTCKKKKRKIKLKKHKYIFRLTKSAEHLHLGSISIKVYTKIFVGQIFENKKEFTSKPHVKQTVYLGYNSSLSTCSTFSSSLVAAVSAVVSSI